MERKPNFLFCLCVCVFPSCRPNRWPIVDFNQCDAVSERFDTFQLTVRAIRNARAEYDVAIQKRIPAIILSNLEIARSDLQSVRKRESISYWQL